MSPSETDVIRKFKDQPELFVTTEYLQDIFDAITDPIIVRDLNHDIILANKVAEEFYGKYMVGNKCYRAQRGNSSPCGDCPVDKTAETRQPIMREVIDKRTGDTLLINTYPLFNKQGELRGVVESARVISGIKKVEQEIRRLYDRVNAQNRDLIKQQNQSELELDMARDIQRSLLPQELCSSQNLDFAARYLPSGKVGGDMYDLVKLSDGRLCFVIADVSGHGVPAALIASMAKMIFLSSTSDDPSPKSVLSKINGQLCQNIGTGHFITAFYGIFDVNGKQLRYTSAAHPPPILCRGQNHVAETDTKIELLDSEGLVVGAFPHETFEERVVELETGDKIIFYTDGVIECRDDDGERFGLDNLQRLIIENRSLSVSDLVDKIIDGVHSFIGGENIRDDVTVVITEVV